MKIRNSFQAFSALVLGISTILPLLAIAPASATVTGCHWNSSGSGDHVSFNDVGNWANCTGTGGLPGPSDTVTFDFSGLSSPSNLTLNNNISGLTVAGLAFTNSTDTDDGSTSITLTGNEITVNSSVVADKGTWAKIDTPLKLGGNVTATVNDTDSGMQFGEFNGTDPATVDTNGHSLNFAGTGGGCGIYMDSEIAGSGGLNVNMPNGGVILGSDATSYTGAVAITNGILSINSAHAVGSTSGVTVSGSGSLGLGLTANTTYSFPLSLGGAGFANFGAATLSAWENTALGCSGGPSTATYTATFTGPVTLTSDITYGGDQNTNVTGTYTSNGHKITVNSGTAGTITTANGSVGAPAETTTVAAGDNQPNQPVNVVANQTYVIDGQRGDTYVYKKGILKGSGSLGNVYVFADGTVAPGHSPGCLTTKNFDLEGTYQVEVGGTTPCSGYDQIKAIGTVGISTTGTTPTGTLEATLYNGFVPKVGQSYTIIDNDGTDAVTGTFAGIAEGGTYTNQGVTYTVTYKGGDGNDVVLTVKSIDASKLPKAPNTGMQLVMAHPIIGLAFTTVAALGMVVIARRLKPAQR